jgi:mono/diheme cytochrome c family protein
VVLTSGDPPMKPPPAIVGAIAICGWIAAAGRQADAAPASPTAEAVFAASCFRCHGEDGEVNGEFDLRMFPAAADLKADPHLLTKVIEAVRDGEMPPEGEGTLASAERDALVSQLDELFAESLETQAPPGRTPIRRMNRFQYSNAVTDLFDLKVELFGLQECVARDISGYFQPEAGKMPDKLQVGNRILGKGQLIVPRLEGVVPFPQDPKAANGFDNRGDLLSLTPLLMESFLELAGSIVNSPNFGPQTCGIWESTFEAPPATEPADQAIAARLRPFLTRAFRREVDAETLGRYVSFANERLKAGGTFPDAMKAATGAALASPRFLYLGDGATESATPEPLDAHELASRLSFFLWGSGPDDELLSAAASGALRTPGILAAQAERMMNSRRMKRFCDAFGVQWLKVEHLTSSEPDKAMFPDFYEFGIISWVKRGSVHMMIEPLLVFETVFVENRSILDLVHSDFTYRTPQLQQFLTKAEKISPPTDGPNWSETLVFERMPVTSKREGGVITTAGIMTMTSGPADTKPISRGKWVVETIWNDPPPPPPGNVPGIEKISATDADAKPLTLREKFALHASSAACSACHSKIDPFGFALENYDPVGRWRDADGHGQPIDASGMLFGRVSFQTVEDFKDALLGEKERFARAFAGHLLKYALGRELVPADRPALDRIVAAAAPGGYQMRELMKQVVASEPFLTKVNPEKAP